MRKAKVKKIVLDSYGSYLGVEKGCLVVKTKSEKVSKYPMFETEVGVRFFVEGLYRNAKIQGFTGETELEGQGTLYYFEEYIPELDFWQAKNEIRAEKPSGPNIRSVSEAVVDFGGFSVTIGFIIRF